MPPRRRNDDPNSSFRPHPPCLPLPCAASVGRVGTLELRPEANRRGKPVALCTVIRAQGSVPRHAGSKMLVFEDGSIEGSIGGGQAERRVARGGVEACAS